MTGRELYLRLLRQVRPYWRQFAGGLLAMAVGIAGATIAAGAAADRLSARKLLAFGLGLLVVADVILAIAASPLTAFIGVAFWGLHMAFTQGLLSKLVADTAPSELRGTAFGVFNLVSGVVLLPARSSASTIHSMPASRTDAGTAHAASTPGAGCFVNWLGFRYRQYVFPAGR